MSSIPELNPSFADADLETQRILHRTHPSRQDKVNEPGELWKEALRCLRFIAPWENQIPSILKVATQFLNTKFAALGCVPLRTPEYNALDTICLAILRNREAPAPQTPLLVSPATGDTASPETSPPVVAEKTPTKPPTESVVLEKRGGRLYKSKALVDSDSAEVEFVSSTISQPSASTLLLVPVVSKQSGPAAAVPHPFFVGSVQQRSPLLLILRRIFADGQGSGGRG
ncbi:hypothetical protein BDZ97DRAFT_1915269 [Flammula alnicola]|nr:hypothetical protein BDZ97DRAFT_1915269 [Flammula alnicola]